MKLRNGTHYPLHDVAEAVKKLESLAELPNGGRLTKDLYRLATYHKQAHLVGESQRAVFAERGLTVPADAGASVAVVPVIGDVLVSSTHGNHRSAHSAGPFENKAYGEKLHRMLHAVEEPGR